MHILFILLPLALALAFPCLVRRAQLSGLREAALADPRQLGD
ncbi:hypothetical protein [Roseateles puraquae]